MESLIGVYVLEPNQSLFFRGLVSPGHKEGTKGALRISSMEPTPTTKHPHPHDPHDPHNKGTNTTKYTPSTCISRSRWHKENVGCIIR